MTQQAGQKLGNIGECAFECHFTQYLAAVLIVLHYLLPGRAGETHERSIHAYRYVLSLSGL